MTNTVEKLQESPSPQPRISVVEKSVESTSSVLSIAKESLHNKPKRTQSNSELLNYRNSKGVVCVDKITQVHTEEFKQLLTHMTVELAQKLGLSVTDIICNVNDDQSTLNIGLKASTVNFFGLDHYGRSYLSHCSSFDFNPAWLGVKFKPNQTEMVITGYDPEGKRLRIFNGNSALWVREVSFSNIRDYFKQNV
tara:strand:- start:6517 stop:7098 length:582 start_codon:yes stop_codon:yes gene_type:complete